MITSFKTFKIALLLVSSLMIWSCTEKDEEQPVIGKVNFSKANLMEIESATLPLGINLQVDTYNHTGGKAHIEVVGGTYGQDYVLSTGSDSFDIDIQKGSQLATFTFTPLNDQIVENAIDISFVITNVTGGLALGTDKEFVLKLLDDDIPTIGTVSFSNTTFQVNENVTTDNVVSLAFNQPTTYGGTITIAASGNAVYGTDYTVQGQTSGNFTITVPPLANTAQFIVNSVDDTVSDLNKNVTFTITGVTGGLQFQSPNATTFTFIDNEVVPIPINYVETFEGFTGSSTYLTNTLGYTVQTINQSANITTLMNANNAANGYADVTTVTGTSNNGINLFHNAGNPANNALLGDLDQVLISPNMTGNGNVTFSIDYNQAFTAQNNALVTFYWTTNYTPGPFNPAQWTQLGTDTAANMVAEGIATSAYKRRTFAITPQNNFRVAVRVTQNINATNYRTRWRFDNIKITN